MKQVKKYLVMGIIFLLLCGCNNMESIENLSVITGFGYDIEKDKDDKISLISAIEFVSVQEKHESNTDFFDGKGNSIYSSIENYKSKQGKPFRYGSELVYIISEERAEYGIEDAVFDLVNYPDVNINAKILVCKEKCKNYFSINDLEESIAERLSNIVKFQDDEYYFSDQYTVNDFLCMYYQQGRNVYLPYVELVKENPQLSGVAIFNKDKLFKVVPVEEANLMNILRGANGKGIISITSEDPLEYVEMEGKNKTKVKVSKENEKLKYDIKVHIDGDLRVDTLYNKEFTKDQVLEFEKLFEKELKKELNSEVEKVQQEYQFDCIDLGKYALAKFGRKNNYDDQQHFINSDINVEVDVKLKYNGRIKDSSKGE